MNPLELQEAEAIHREEALRRIAGFVKRYGITRADLLKLAADATPDGAPRKVLPEVKRFDPFFDGWR
jgi:hypothetical protein